MGTGVIAGVGGLAWAAGKAFLTALVLTPIVRDIFRAYNVVDRPGTRKVHAYPIPRLGGVSIAVAYLIGLTGMLGQAPAGAALGARILPGAAVMFATGMLDDFFNLSPRLKLAGQILASAIAFAAGLRFPGPAPLSFVITVGWLLLAANAFNLVDGLDGLCSGMGVVASGAAFAAALMQHNAALAIATLPLVGALTGFLFHNFSRATVFLGDSGALVVGFLAGCFSLMWSAESAGRIGMLAPILALSVPLLDVGLSIVRRRIQGRPLFSADRGHVHHRMLDRVSKPQKAASILYLWAAGGAGLAVLLSYRPLGGWRWLIIALFCLAIWVFIRQLRYPEFKVANRLLKGEFQRVLRAGVRAENLAAALQRSRTEDEWWDALASAAHESGWAGIAWLRNESVRREKIFAEDPVWSFRVNLNPEEAVRVDGAFSPLEPMDLVAFAGAVQGSFASRARVWEQPKLT